MAEEEFSRLDEIIAKELDYIEAMDKDDDKRADEVKIFCQIFDKAVEDKKLSDSAWQTEYKYFKEQEIQQIKINADADLQKMKQEHEMSMQALKQNYDMEFQHFKWECERTALEQEKELKAKENEVKKKQIKTDLIKTGIDLAKCILTIGAFVIFEKKAHDRDVLDVIDRDAMHIKKNPLFGKLRPY